ncbi:MAG: lamin tail domain-containing protein, partial [Bacteroidales bacterium]
FIELHNAGDTEIDISGWTLTHHQTQMPAFSSVKIPAGTKLAAKGFYLLGLSSSGLAVPAKKGETVLFVRTTAGMSAGDMIEIGTGPAAETSRIASLTAPPVPQAPATPFGFGRRGPSGQTTVWQPLPDGPVITVPAGSTNIPVTSVDGFEVGQKMAIGYGAKYPAVAMAVEKYEVVTITGVGKQGTQAWLSMDARTGDTNIKVSSVENISVGDKIRLDIDSEGHGIETVTVTRVGTQSSRSTFNGPLTDADDPGTGLDLAEPLKFAHASNMPFSVRGTGISFEPATSFAHSSNEPVLALRHSITLDQPLAYNHEIDDVISDEKVTTAGYRGTIRPDQWFGGPALSASAGNMVLRDADNNVADALNYGGLVDPWAAEGYQAASGAGASGCFVPSPSMMRGFWMGPAVSVTQPNRSAGRYPDGTDNDSNCRDFMIQNTVALAALAASGSDNIKVSSVTGFSKDQSIIIGSGAASETAVIAAIGTSGATTTEAAIPAGRKIIRVGTVAGFSAGQTITIDDGSRNETAVIAAVGAARRRFGGQPTSQVDSITVSVPLRYAHARGVQVSGSGITIATPLTMDHDNGAQVASNLPTPGEPNQYFRRP